MQKLITEKKRVLDDFGADYYHIDFNSITSAEQLDRVCQPIIRDAMFNPSNPRYNESEDDLANVLCGLSLRNKIKHLHFLGWLTNEIASYLKVTPSSVYSELSRHDLKANNRLERAITAAKRRLRDFCVDYSEVDFNKVKNRGDLDLLCNRLIRNRLETKSEVIPKPEYKPYTRIKLTKAEKKEKIIYLHKKGCSVGVICQEADCYPQNVYKVLKECR